MGKQRKLPDGMWQRGKTYFARFRANGREVRKRLSTDFRVACELLRELRARADKADFGLVDNDYKWAALKEEFLKWAKQVVRDWKNYQQDLAKFEEYVAVNSVREIDRPLVIGFRQWRLDQEVTPRTVNRQVGTIHNMLNKGVEWKRIGWNPIAGIKPLPHDKPKKKRRSLMLAEVQAILAASPQRLKSVWLTYMTTGIRRSELVGLTFHDIDFERKVMTIPASMAKNHKEREIPLDDDVVAIMAGLRDGAKFRKPVDGLTVAQTARQAARFSKDHIFVSKANTPLRNNLLKRFYATCKRAGIEGAQPGGSVDIHALRVSFITLSLEHGGNPKAIQTIVGHSSLEMTMNTYARATDKSKREAVAALPFAKVSAPPHVIPMQDAHKVRTTDLKSPEDKVG
jgi:integrase